MLQYPLLMLQSDPEVWLTAILPHSADKPKEFKVAKKRCNMFISLSWVFLGQTRIGTRYSIDE